MTMKVKILIVYYLLRGFAQDRVKIFDCVPAPRFLAFCNVLRI